MAFICGQCGATCEDTVRFCTQCGHDFGEPMPAPAEPEPEEVVEEAAMKAPEEVAEPTEEPTAETVAPSTQEETPKKAGIGGLITAIVVSIATVIGMIVILASFSGPEEAVKPMMNAYCRGDASVFIQKAGTAAFGEDEDSFAPAYFEALVERDKRAYATAFRDGYDVDYDIVSTKALSPAEVSAALSLLPESAGDSVDEMVITTVRIKVSGDGQELAFTRELHLAYENGQWRILSMD